MNIKTVQILLDIQASTAIGGDSVAIAINLNVVFNVEGAIDGSISEH